MWAAQVGSHSCCFGKSMEADKRRTHSRPARSARPPWGHSPREPALRCSSPGGNSRLCPRVEVRRDGPPPPPPRPRPQLCALSLGGLSEEALTVFMLRRPLGLRDTSSWTPPRHLQPHLPENSCHSAFPFCNLASLRPPSLFSLTRFWTRCLRP